MNRGTLPYPGNFISEGLHANNVSSFHGLRCFVEEVVKFTWIGDLPVSPKPLSAGLHAYHESSL